MAGDWIKMRIDLAEDPAVIAVANALKLDEATIVGHLHHLWSWADQQTIDGNAAGVTETWLDRYIGVTGFVRAMVEVGWLTIKESDSEGGLAGVLIPNFDVHNSESAKQRALTARRVAKSRAQKRNATGVTKTLQQRYQRREEKRREEEEKKPPFNPPRGKVVVTEDIDAIISHYKTHHPRARPGAKERKLIANRLSESYSVEDLCRAIDGCHRSAYHAGQNKDATVYQSLELIIRDSKHVQQFLEVPAEPLKPVIQTAPSVLDRISTLGKGDRS